MSKIGDYYIKDDKNIGRGTFGNVYQAYKNRQPETIYALKKIDLHDLNEKDKQHCYGEVEAMRNLHHQNIVKFHDSFKHDEGRYLIIVMEYCQVGSLKNYIQRSQPMSEQGCLEITRDVSSALEFLHDRKTMHRDVKTDNIFLTVDKKAKLGDFGLTRLLDNPTVLTQDCGSPLYRSPEIFKGQPYSEKTDIWSLGCCMYEMATKTTPFSGWTEEELRGNVTEQKVQERAIPYSEDVKGLILAMLRKNPEQRPSISEVSWVVESLLDRLQTAALPNDMYDMKIEHASMTYPQRSSKMLAEKNIRSPLSNGGQTIERPEKTRHSSEPVPSSKEPVMSPGALGTRIEHIPVEMTPKEVDLMKHANQLATTLKGYTSDSEWCEIRRVLDEHSKSRDLNLTVFLERMEQILCKETFESTKALLKAYWDLSEPLLARSFRLAHPD